MISLNHLKEVQKKEEQIKELRGENQYLQLQNKNLQKELRIMSDQVAKENDKFISEIEGQHLDMEEYFKKMQD